MYNYIKRNKKMIGFLAGFLGTALLTSRRTTTRNIKPKSDTLTTGGNRLSVGSGVFVKTGKVINLSSAYFSNKLNLSSAVMSSVVYNGHKWIEGYDPVGYRDTRGIPTVGIGITLFRSTGQKPVVGKRYPDDFLEREYWLLVNEKNGFSRKFFNSFSALGRSPYQSEFDVVADMFFQGFSSYRQAEAKKHMLKGRIAFANWLLTPDGMWKQFWNPANRGAYRSRWGVLRRAIWRAHLIMGVELTGDETMKMMEEYRKGKRALFSPLF